MSLPSIAIVNFSSQLADQEVQEAIRAVNRQVIEDFMPIWGAGRICKLHNANFQPSDINTLSLEPVLADSVIYLVDEGLLPGALGFHDLNARDMPFGFVFILDSQDWTVTLSHEVLELIIDPTVNILVPGPDPRDPSNIVLHTYEVCDAVERMAYDIDGIRVSNFLTPSYFTIGDAPGTRNDFLGVNVPSFGVTRNSHIAFFDLTVGGFVTVIGSMGVSSNTVAKNKFVDHPKASRPSEEQLQSVLTNYHKNNKGKLPYISAITRYGRYEASAKRLYKGK